jgi:predicted dehydrogenase
MSTYKVGIIGCGRPRNTAGATGFGMSHAHAQGYIASPDTEIVALADINLENAKAFQERNGGERIYTDYHEMLEKEDLDIVSVSTWPHLHAEMVIAAAQSGVKAIHCEKPMAPTFGESRRMVEVCEENGVQLTFNHQRRFGAMFRKTRELLQAGAIGELLRVEGTCPDLFDWGTHWFDMVFFYNGETPAEWVIGQVDMRNHRTVFGVTLEGHGVSHFKLQNGVHGLLTTGWGSGGVTTNRLYGTEGTIEINPRYEIPLRVWAKGQSNWESIQVNEGMHSFQMVEQGVLDLIDALKTEREPELSARRALRATELIFGTYESSRRRARVDLPLNIEDSPLHAMLDAGDLVIQVTA